MTTDITELAQRMKAAAEKATHGQWLVTEQDCRWNIDDESGRAIAIAQQRTPIRDDYKQAERTANAEFIALANPANILALVEALEAAQQDQQKFSFSMTQNEMEKYAEMYRSDNNDSSSAFLPASEITWIEGFLSPHAFSSVFTHESATNWLNSEVKIHKGDQIADTYIDLQKNPAVNPVVVVFQKGKPMIWDGYHRIAAAIIRGQPIYAIFSISLLEPLVLATELESRTVKLPPKIERNDDDGWFMYNGGRVGGGAAEWYNKALDDVGAELTAAGIKVETE